MALWSNTDTLAGAPLFESWVETFDGTDVTAAANTITITDHQFTDGDKVLYNDGTGGSVDGIADGDFLYVDVIDTNTIKLYQGWNGTAFSTLEEFGGSSAGTGHQLKFIPQDIFFIDSKEAGVTGNIAKGLSSPGWWKYTSYDAADGEGGTVTRHKAELLCAISEAGVGVADAGVDGSDDSKGGADATFEISAQPTAAAITEGATAVIDVTAASNNEDAVFSFVWSYDPAGGTNYVPVTTTTHPDFAVDADGTLTFSTAVDAADPHPMNGDKFRVVITGNIGGVESTLTSNPVTLTVNNA